jgi:hypothetical protein
MPTGMQCGHILATNLAVPGGVERVSELDKRIIEHLQQDGRRPFT